MKWDDIITQAMLAILLPGVVAYPGGRMAKNLQIIKARAAAAIDSVEDSDEMIGDLVTPGPTTPVGQLIANIIVGKADGQSQEGYTAPGAIGTPQCSQDTCCVWSHVADELKVTFAGDAGRCTDLARGSIRLGFHDAGTWKKGNTFGGADGSMLLSDEVTRIENRGLEETVQYLKAILAKYSPNGVGAADLVQFAASVATVVCPLGPRVRTFVGRKDNSALPPQGLLPNPNADVESLIQMFEDKTIKPHGLVALIGAHTTSQQRFFDPSRAGDPQDSTPGTWDVKFYNETLNPQAPERVIKFPSDVKFSVHPRMSSEWLAFTDPASGQAHWGDDYAKEYVRLSLLGVNNINSLTECSKVLPPQIGAFTPSQADEQNLWKWVNGGFKSGIDALKLGNLIQNGHDVSNNSLAQNGIDPNKASVGLSPTFTSKSGRPGRPTARPTVRPGRPQQGRPQQGGNGGFGGVNSALSGFMGGFGGFSGFNFPTGKNRAASATGSSASLITPIPATVSKSATVDNWQISPTTSVVAPPVKPVVVAPPPPPVVSSYIIPPVIIASSSSVIPVIKPVVSSSAPVASSYIIPPVVIAPSSTSTSIVPIVTPIVKPVVSSSAPVASSYYIPPVIMPSSSSSSITPIITPVAKPIIAAPPPPPAASSYYIPPVVANPVVPVVVPVASSIAPVIVAPVAPISTPWPVASTPAIVVPVPASTLVAAIKPSNVPIVVPAGPVNGGIVGVAPAAPAGPIAAPAVPAVPGAAPVAVPAKPQGGSPWGNWGGGFPWFQGAWNNAKPAVAGQGAPAAPWGGWGPFGGAKGPANGAKGGYTW